MKTAERELARALRREHGVSVKRLARMLGVSTSSVSLWVRDIELRPEQIAALRQAAVGGARHHRAAGLARRRAAQAHGRGVARFRDPNHIAGCMLYWAEGSRNRHVVEFVNSDPAMMRFFVAFIRRWFPEAERKIRVTPATSSPITRSVNARSRISGSRCSGCHGKRSARRRSTGTRNTARRNAETSSPTERAA
jgi:AcrR family transcriptional regulator